MKVKELMALLSDYDPDSDVEVVKSSSDWGWDDKEQCSVEYDTVDWSELNKDDVKVNGYGVVRIGSVSYE